MPFAFRALKEARKINENESKPSPKVLHKRKKSEQRRGSEGNAAP